MLLVFLKWAALGPASLLMAVVGRILAPILPLFVRENGFLPKWLSWFQTPDNTCDGDAGNWERHPGLDAWSTYKRRVAWFWRNVAYGFDIDVLGLDAKAGDTLDLKGDIEAGTNPAKNGYVWRVLRRADGSVASFQLYFVYQWPVWPTRCIRGNLGWKLWGFGAGVSSYQWTGMVNPLFGCTP